MQKKQMKETTFRNCAPFTKCIISRINNTDTDNAYDIDVVMPMYNSIEYSDNYSKNLRKFMAVLQRRSKQ